MEHSAPRSVLTLGDQRTIARAHAVLIEARRRVALENRLAAGTPRLDHRDPCWQLVSEVTVALEGAILPPERRHHLLARANRLGLRAFDANLVIALVQDRARRGEALHESSPIALIHHGKVHRVFDPMPLLALATALGVALGAVAAFARFIGV